MEKSGSKASHMNNPKNIDTPNLLSFKQRQQLSSQEKDVAMRLEQQEQLVQQRKEQRAREKELKQKRRKLVNRLEQRPRDQKALVQLIDIAYELEDYYSAVTLIKRIQGYFPEQKNPEQYMRLARCSMRRWRKDGQSSDLMLAKDAYGKALQDPAELMKPLANPMHFLEYVGVLMRSTDSSNNHQHHVAMDLLGAMVSRWADEYGVMMICQYLMAQILVIRGNLDEAYKLYQQRLLLCPRLLEPLEDFQEKDGVVSVTVAMVSILIQVEAAAVQKKLGMTKHFVGMLAEAYSRQERGGPIELADSYKVDICFGHSSFKSWVSSPITFNKLHSMFYSLGNVAAAAEMAEIATELYSQHHLSKCVSAMSLPRPHKVQLCAYLLDRAECLAELAVFEGEGGAEACAHYAYNLLKTDVVVCGRASRCCLGNKKENVELFAAALSVKKAVALVSRILRRKVAVRRKLARLALGVQATVINAAVRMALVRNRLAPDLLSVTSMSRIGPAVRYFQKCLWKSGQHSLAQWVDFWDTSVNIIQRCMWRWYIWKLHSRQIRGVNVLKRLWRGQVVRRQLRDALEVVQEELEDGEECGSGQHGFYFDTVSVHRVSAAVVVVTSHQNNETSLNVEEGTDFGIDHFIDDVDNFSESGDFDNNEDLLTPLRSQSKVSSSLKQKSLTPELTSSTFTEARPPLVGSRSESSLLTKKGKFLHEEKESVQEHSLKMKPRSERLSPSKFTNEVGSQVRAMASWYNESLGSHSASFSQKSTSHTHKKSVPISSALLTQEELEAYVKSATETGEDVVSLVSLKSVQDDPAMRWVPFCVLPNPAIARVLTCTVLVITSPSFSVYDSQRIVYMCKRFPHLWANLRSLFVYGTSLRRGHGLTNMLSLGFVNMHTLSLGHLGLNSSFGEFLGDLLADSHPKKKRCTPSSLTKLYIEDEKSLGDTGISLLVKKLQYNTSLRVLSVRNCHLTKKSSNAIARYVGVSSSLEVLNVNDNCFSLACCRQFLTTVANKGVKGNFSALHCTGNHPKLSHDEVVSMLREGMSLRVNVISGEVDTGGAGFLEEVKLEKEMLDKQNLDVEQDKLNTVKKYISEVKTFGSVADWEKVSMVGIKAQKALYL